jgi:heat-inducible transcriptional repressor
MSDEPTRGAARGPGPAPRVTGVQDTDEDAVRIDVEVPGAVTAAEEARPSAGDVADVELDDRKLAVLHAIVAEYVAGGEPVGSKRVVEAAHLDVSAATVRNEMVALEELGFITQPHTSAGRVPTDRGYRRFVDDLRENRTLDAPRREMVQELLGSAGDVEDLLARTSSVLSQLTRLVSLVIAPAIDASRLKLVELVGLTPASALLLLVADTGRVEKRSVELPAGTTDSDLERVRTVLGEHVRGRRLGEVHGVLRRIADDAPSDLRELVGSLADATAIDLADDTVHRVFVGGQASLVGDRSFEREHLSRMLQLLEERATLARLLSDATADDEPTVRIGGENEVEDLRAASLVAQRYRMVTAGSLGVLGPTRMDYAEVLATVRVVADQLQETLTDLSR